MKIAITVLPLGRWHARGTGPLKPGPTAAAQGLGRAIRYPTLT
jgi:hypothetical protein